MHSIAYKFVRLFTLGLLLSLVFINHSSAQFKTENFDEGWLFHRGGMLGAENPQLDDSKWRQIDLPHDWSIEDLPGTQSPFNKDAISQIGGGFTSQGTAWYRKAFNIPLADSGKQVIVQFDGVYMNADVFVNGKRLGNHPNGYTSFYYSITPNLKLGAKNTIAVEVKNEGQNNRWYTGSGIYRHVWLKVLNPVHIAQWGTFITTPSISETAATINIRSKIVNQGTASTSVNVITSFKNSTGREVGKTTSQLTLNSGEQKEISENTEIKDSQLWSCETPVLYEAVTEVYQNNQLVDRVINSFGIRKISFDVNNGFQLNGKTVKLKGGCFHDDNGPLGGVAYDRAEERKVELLKASGFNAIRCSHNPPSPAFLDACDRLGMLVIDEAFDVWNKGKNPYDYHLYFKDWWQADIESMVTRDCNHPGIIMWSIGNEIPEKGLPLGAEAAHVLAKYVRNIDATRPITAAVNELTPDKDPFFAALDVCGYNYAVERNDQQTNAYKKDHQRMPQRVMFGTESYPLEAFDNWMSVKDNVYVLGDFVWTAWDYIGEASIGWRGYPQNNNFFPWNLAFCGDIDICGWKRPQSYYRDALWKADQLSIFVVPPTPSFPKNPDRASWSKWNWADVVPEWNWSGHEGKPMEINIYSSCDEVELFLNNKSLGKKPTNRDSKFMAVWSVPYHAGQLKAIGYSDGKMVNQSILNTAGVPVSIKLSADRKNLKADNEDLSYVTINLVDSNGNINPQADNLLEFSIAGNGKIVGVGNANPMSLESYQQYKHKAWKGKCLVIVKTNKTPGDIILKVKSKGLADSHIKLTSIY